MKKRYIMPVCEMVSISHEQSLLLTLSVFDEETEIVGAKENDWDWNQEDDIFEVDKQKSNDVWGEFDSDAPLQ